MNKLQKAIISTAVATSLVAGAVPHAAAEENTGAVNAVAVNSTDESNLSLRAAQPDGYNFFRDLKESNKTFVSDMKIFVLISAIFYFGGMLEKALRIR